MPYTDAELLADLQAVADQTDSPPTQAAYRDHGTYNVTTFYDHFGSWRAAVSAAGFEPNHPSGAIKTETLIEDLQQFAADCGETPSAPQMDADGPHAAATYFDRFGSWNAALEGAELTPIRQARVSDTDLLTALTELVETLERPPATQEMADQGAYHPATYHSRFGSWNDALAEAGLGTRDTYSQISDEALINELHRLQTLFDRRPTTTDMADSGAYSSMTYRRRFGSWREALAVAFDGDAGVAHDKSE